MVEERTRCGLKGITIFVGAEAPTIVNWPGNLVEVRTSWATGFPTVSNQRAARRLVIDCADHGRTL